MASLRVAANSCTRDGVSFTEQQRADGMFIVDELRALFANSGRPVRLEAERCPSLLQALPLELLVAVIRLLDSRSLVRFASTCRFMWADRTRPMSPVQKALRQRAGARARCIPMSVPARFNGWVSFLLSRDGLADMQSSAAAGYALCPQPVYRP